MKKLVFVLCIIIIALSSFIGYKIFINNKTKNIQMQSLSKVEKNETEKSVSVKIGNKVEKQKEEEAIQEDSDEKTKFVLREANGKIVIYQINKNGEEVEYDKTNISTQYLTEVDKINIKEGLKVTGKEKLYELLENFE